MASFRLIESTAIKLAEQYGFQEISTPLIEFTEVFTRTLGDTSDIVTKEMLYDTISSFAGVSDLLQNAIYNAAISIDDLDLHNIADWPWWPCTESEGVHPFCPSRILRRRSPA